MCSVHTIKQELCFSFQIGNSQYQLDLLNNNCKPALQINNSPQSNDSSPLNLMLDVIIFMCLKYI